MLLGVLSLRVMLRELLVLSVLLVLAVVLLLLLLESRLLLLLQGILRRDDRLRVGVGIRILLLSVLINDVGSIRVHNTVS